MHKKSLKDIGGQFKDRHKGRLIRALDNTADSLGEALPSEVKRTFEMARKICLEEHLSPEEQGTLEATLIKTRQGEHLSQKEKETLKTALKIYQGKALSPEEKETLEGALMRSLEHQSSTAASGHGVFEMDIHGAAHQLSDKKSIFSYLPYASKQ